MSEYVKQAIQSVTRGQKSFCKFLSSNDTGRTGGHQAGIYIPKPASSILFDTPCQRGTNVDRRADVKWQGDIVTHSRFIYYGARTRNEYRITNCGDRHYNPLEEDNTGALFVLVQENYETYAGWILNTDEDIEGFLSAFGISPTATGNLIDTANLSSEMRVEIKISNVVAQIGTEFPQAERMSELARIIHEEIFNHSRNIVNNPDQKLLQWIEMEYELFRNIEEAKYGNKIRNGFDNIQEFIEFANSVLNRRKSRAGKSLEYHLRAIFDANKLPYEWQPLTEGNKHPDFILAAKTTCKDRRRQVINEADRVRGRIIEIYKLRESNIEQGRLDGEIHNDTRHGVACGQEYPHDSVVPNFFPTRTTRCTLQGAEHGVKLVCDEGRLGDGAGAGCTGRGGLLGAGCVNESGIAETDRQCNFAGDNQRTRSRGYECGRISSGLLAEGFRRGENCIGEIVCGV